MTEKELINKFGINPEGGIDPQQVSELTTMYENLLIRCLDDEFGIESKSLRKDIELALDFIYDDYIKSKLEKL